ncbi:18.1 kDa class I heat shock protein-like [Lathyrus oleraceus]|uniref:SHSP domain-containing protein n=1 Tax=Pisum sativum TaxID=3888 RepID=A0A9D4VMQ8_PEA|nr:18.1 kDa class I heat shock protein-like [Pisum sativum]KAI5386685.1 hypothetical protein KIW84_073002 [Pisum sativum]
MSMVPSNNIPFDGSSIQELSRENPSFLNEQVDWKETAEAHVLKAEIPRLKKEEVSIEVEDGRVLQIRGERSMEKEESNDGCHRVERSSGKFMRSFTLPSNCKLHEVKASMEDGVLTVTIPKDAAQNNELLTGSNSNSN